MEWGKETFKYLSRNRKLHLAPPIINQTHLHPATLPQNVPCSNYWPDSPRCSLAFCIQFRYLRCRAKLPLSHDAMDKCRCMSRRIQSLAFGDRIAEHLWTTGGEFPFLGCCRSGQFWRLKGSLSERSLGTTFSFLPLRPNKSQE